ncbi:aldehyde dehydrogenase (NADP(+)) [Flavobacterium cheongpyeongense]|uniref:Aldehyde dehydrogenase (NADP(+)) n=1 Tax=Flavobacterium cheongpyeongense TaxID=2212651 RepID=A0A2V4BTH8_9FLAO|nr:aldehyde dehydrogenase (NADP(+)) [Flavobacterium cheongpyeongense]PXY42368.1 aldehyde dehydrogenase (NADP(+)) [Flavobacterium cheongpyeongense]
MITGKNYIGSQLIAGGDKVFKTFNPQLNIHNPWQFTEATTDEIKLATAIAHHAFLSFQKATGKEKALFLRTIAEEIMTLGEDLLDVYCQESGLPKGRAEGERGRTIGQLNAFADLVEEGSWVEATIDTAIPDRKPLPKVDIRKMMRPLGTVVVFGSSNFPFAYSTAGGDTASALASGCPVIVKSHPMHAGTSEMVASAIIKAAQKTNMPEGVFSNLNSSGIEVGVQLVKDPLVKAVGFTGSINGGRALYDLAAGRPEPIPVFAEMGSINPVVILPDALKQNAQKWAIACAGSVTLGAGQFCTNPGLILGIKNDDLENFSNQLANEILKMDPICMLSPSIHKNYEVNKDSLSSQQGVQVVAAYDKNDKPNYAAQKIVTVSGKEFLKNTVLHKEVFGPFSMIVQCENKAELVAVLNALEGQLTGTILGEETEIKTFNDVVDALGNRVGRIIFNGMPTGVEVCPAMVHGGPYPSSSDSRFTAVGIDAIKRWVRPFSYQNWPNDLLPEALQNENPLGLSRLVNNIQTTDSI